MDYRILYRVLIFISLFQLLPGSVKAGDHKAGIIETALNYTEGTTQCRGYIAYNPNLKGRQPAVLVVHEWWGCNDYARKRARMLAELGYVAVAVDLYGDGKVAADPEQAMQYARPFYTDPGLMMRRVVAALTALKVQENVDTNKIAGIGYCFGGSMLLNAAKLGVPFKGVVSFHGGLNGVPAKPGVTSSRILVCHGGADSFVSAEEIRAFKVNLDSAGVRYEWKVYPGATHAFTNPEATKIGLAFHMPIRYNASGDKQSWIAMQRFLKDVFH